MSTRSLCTGVAAVVSVAVCLSLSANFARADYMPGDTNHDGTPNSLDIDAIYQNLTVAPPDYLNWPRPLVPYSAQYDVNTDSVVSQSDVTYELMHTFNTGYGDADLNGSIGFSDFQVVLDHMNQFGGWASGDFNGDGKIDMKDWWIIMGVHPGDSNGDWRVDFADFQSMLDHWQMTNAKLADGDLSGDGIVNFKDFQMLLDYWNPSGYYNPYPIAGGGGIVPMPEPATLALLAMGGLALLRRRK